MGVRESGGRVEVDVVLCFVGRSNGMALLNRHSCSVPPKAVIMNIFAKGALGTSISLVWWCHTH